MHRKPDFAQFQQVPLSEDWQPLDPSDTSPTFKHDRSPLPQAVLRDYTKARARWPQRALAFSGADRRHRLIDAELDREHAKAAGRRVVWRPRRSRRWFRAVRDAAAA
jgi:hypothetical protein